MHNTELIREIFRNAGEGILISLLEYFRLTEVR